MVAICGVTSGWENLSLFLSLSLSAFQINVKILLLLLLLIIMRKLLPGAEVGFFTLPESGQDSVPWLALP